MDVKISQVFSNYLDKHLLSALKSEFQLGLSPTDINEQIDNINLTNLDARGMFNLGEKLPVEELGIYANILATSLTIRHWLDGLQTLLEELSGNSTLFKIDVTDSLITLHLPLHPNKFAHQCVMGGLIFQLANNVELISNNLITCNLNNVFIRPTATLATDKACDLVSFTIAKSNLAYPLVNANIRVYDVFKRQLSIQQRGQKNKANIEYRVVKEVIQTSDWFNLSQSSVASKLAMSERSLARKLQQEGLKFRDIVVSARNTQALELLFKGVAIGKVGESLGFCDRATFERSFKKWQGLSPAKIQAQYVLLASESDVNTIINAHELPHLPTTMTQLLALLKKDNTDIDQVIELLETDPVLVAKILCIANSSMYSHIKADNLKQAVVAIFGFDKLYALTLSIVSTSKFSKTIDSIDYKKFWHHALLSAWVIEQIADANNVSKDEKETFYLAGLLHNIGELVIHCCLPNKVAQFTTDFSEHITWREHNRYQKLKLGTCTTAVSSFICHLWHIPKPVCALIDVLTPQGETTAQLLVDALDIADYLMSPTKQTQVKCKLIIEKHWSDRDKGKTFLSKARSTRDDLKATAKDLL